MDYIKEYKSFINSYYLSDALRISIGGILPVVVLSYFGWLQAGVIVSLGAICVSAADAPGPISYRRNGMLICTVIIFFVSFLTALAASSTVLLGVLIFVFCFIFSMISVYGGRATSIGVAALIVMVLSLGRSYHGMEILMHAVYITAGALWYTILSLVMYSFRPYMRIQQTLGECIMQTADYLRTRAQFYAKDADYEKIYSRLMQQQVDLHHMQTLLRELLFRSRNIIKESTEKGRTLLMIFVDTVDLFEKSTTSFYDYETLHKYFDNTEVLDRFAEMILHIANELDAVGLAVKSNRASHEPVALQQQLDDLQKYFNQFRDAHRNPETIEGLISLRKILQAMEDMTARIFTLYHYSKYDIKKTDRSNTAEEYEQFAPEQEFGFQLLLDNLGMRSSIFRHALRVSFATIAGYILSHFISGNHGYWILLTIIVILKPAYSLSKKRNYDRLLGTIGGAIVGMIVLFFIKDRTALFIIMLVFMIGSYSFLRTKYFLSVMLMTPYILLMFHLLNTGSFTSIFRERLIDTGIGSVIAFIANFLLVPKWEHEQIRSYMATALKDCLEYFKNVACPFIGKEVSELQFKLSRKDAFVSLANLSEAFSRMLSEPRGKQKDGKTVHQFVVMSHMLTSHIATLSHFTKSLALKYRSENFSPLIDETVSSLESAKNLIEHNDGNQTEKETVSFSDRRLNDLLEQRKAEVGRGEVNTATRITLSEFKPIVDQFRFISGIAKDIRKTCEQLGA
jgi:uncharacterized membrane protein (TIGR01666 family)